MLVVPNDALSSARSAAALSPAAAFRNVSIDIRTVTPEATRFTCTVPHAHFVTRTVLLETSSVWGPHLLDEPVDDAMDAPSRRTLAAFNKQGPPGHSRLSTKPPNK